MIGYVHSYESLAAVDGEGLRYAVFLVGCPLRCIYCHNPDTWCSAGKPTDSDELAKKVTRYKPYFKNGGGVTFSGGEPLLQAEFINACAERLHSCGIEYTLDTSGSAPLTDSVKRALLGADEILLDLKFHSDEDYLKYTSHGISQTLETLDFLEKSGRRTVIKTVIVPGINDSESDIELYFDTVKNYSCVVRYELLPFHTMGFFKYESLGIENKLKDTEALSRKRLDELQTHLDKLMKKQRK